jgi:hypothetical protein
LLREVALVRQVPLRLGVKFPHFPRDPARRAVKTSVHASTRFRVERGREWRQSPEHRFTDIEAKE